MKGTNNKYKHQNQNKYSSSQSQFKPDPWQKEHPQSFQQDDYYHNQSYDNQNYQQYSQNYKPYQGSPQKKYNNQAQYRDYPKQNTNGRQVVNDDNFYENSQKDTNRHAKYRCAKHVQQKQHKPGSEYEFSNKYQDFEGDYNYGQASNAHASASYDTYERHPPTEQFKGKQGYNNHYNEYYYEEDYYNDYQQTQSKSNMPNNKFNKFHAQKHSSDRKTRQKQNSLHTSNSYSSGSQEGKNSSHKKSTGTLKHIDQSDDYQVANPQNQGAQQNIVSRYQRRNYVCYVCKIDLKDFEKEFYPCNCKYQICYSCYYHQVEQKGRKCPNCGKHYEVNRVEEYKQSKMVTMQCSEDDQLKNDLLGLETQQNSEPPKQNLIIKDWPNEAMQYKQARYVPKVKQSHQNLDQNQQNSEGLLNQQKILAQEFNHKINQQNQINYKENNQLQQQPFFEPSPLIKFEIQNIQPKIIKTDEDIPFSSSYLISPGLNFQQEEKAAKDTSVHDKYDLVVVSKTNQEDDQSLNNCTFQQVACPDPEDSECPIDQMSMRSTQTQRQNFLAKSNQHGVLRRMNSQENLLTSQSVLNQTNSQMSHGGYTKSMTNNMSAEIKERIHPAIKGIKLSKIRIIQKSTVYVIGLSPALADESLMRRYEYFGQYGKILQIVINKDNAFTSSIKEDVGGGESTSSNKSQISFAAYITYSSPQDASLAIMALDQFIFDQRLIRASYGRTKYCKYFLKNSTCPAKDCPYKHSESKEQDILTPDDMQKKALFQYCIQLAVQMSMITDMNESQFKEFLKHKRDQRTQLSNSKHVMPSIESIFDNQDLLKKINQFKTCLLSAKHKKGIHVDEKLKNTELSKKQLQTVANKVSRELRFQNSAMEKRTTKDKVTAVKKPRSGSNKNETKQTKSNLIGGPEQIKAQERQSLTPKRHHTISRIFSSSNQEIKIQDLKNHHKGTNENNNNINTFIEKQKQQQLQKGFKNLQANVDEKHPAIVQRTNRLMSKDEVELKEPQTKIKQGTTQKSASASKSQSRNRRRFGSYRRDGRQKSASKSIQRQTSVSSLIDYTLKFLNDDMAIDLTKLRIEDPLIEKSVEEDYPENQSQINRMIKQNQDQFDGKSSIFSNYECRSHPAMGEINLGKINNIYTSPFFLINQENQNDKIESIYQIWENFDNIEKVQDLQKQNSDHKNMQQFESHSYQDQKIQNFKINYPQNNLSHQSPQTMNGQLHHLQHQQFNQYQLQKMNSALTVKAKPFIRTTNQSLKSGSQVVQMKQTNSLKNLNAKPQNLPKELNEKNLYLFDKQQGELFDKQQYWNQIFLNTSNSGQIKNTTSDSGNQQNTGLFNSQSVFCFPIGLDDKKETKKLKQSVSKDNFFNMSDQKQRNSFVHSGNDNRISYFAKRKSIACIQGSPKPTTNKNESAKIGNLTPHKIVSTTAKSNNYKNALTQSSDIKLAQVNINSSNRSSVQQTGINTKFNLVKQAVNSDQQINANDFDRKSAGERFGGHVTSIYQELQKINQLFNSTAYKRRNSCSHSQSHSRVRTYEDQRNIGLLNLRKQEKSTSYLEHVLFKSPNNVSEGAENEMEQTNQI